MELSRLPRGAVYRRIATAIVCVCLLAASGASAKQAGPPQLLPDLVPLYPEQLVGPETGLSLDGGLLNPIPVMVNGCFPDEITRKMASRCLRFDSRVGNVGDGPLEIEYRAEGTSFAAYQRVYLADGTVAERRAIESEFHPTHLHFHIKDFYVARLWRGGPRGPARAGPPVGRGDKSGFCPQDSERIEKDEGEQGNYSCFSLSEIGVPTSFVGISAGWMDIYSAHLPDQYVEVSDVADGRYVLELEIDPNNVIYEANEANNQVCSLIELTGSEAHMVDPEVLCRASRATR